MPVEHEDCTYSDHEFDSTAEEVASPELPPGHGSKIYTEEEWEAIEDHYYSPTMAEEGFRFRETLPGGAGPTGCLTPDCDTVDGRTRAGGVRCNDCEEDLS